MEKAKDALGGRYFEIEAARTDLSDDQKVSEVIKITAAVCAGVAVQPIPFADFFVLTPIQILMGSRIAAIRGYPVSDHQIGEVLKELAGAVGLGVLAQQLVIGAYKTFIPFLGAITTIPIVFGLTYGIGRIFDEYFIRKKRGQLIDPERLKEIFKRARAEGKSAAKSEESDRTTLRTETPSG